MTHEVTLYKVPHPLSQKERGEEQSVQGDSARIFKFDSLFDP